MIILGIDASTKTGFVVVEAGSKPQALEAGEISCKLTGIQRVEAISGKLANVMDTYNVDVSIMENYAFGNKYTLVTLVEIGTLIRYRLHERSIPMMLAAPTSLKKFVCGDGLAKKEAIMMEVYRKWGFVPESNNIADAFGLAMLCNSVLMGSKDPVVKKVAAANPNIKFRFDNQ